MHRYLSYNTNCLKYAHKGSKKNPRFGTKQLDKGLQIGVGFIFLCFHLSKDIRPEIYCLHSSSDLRRPHGQISLCVSI